MLKSRWIVRRTFDGGASLCETKAEADALVLSLYSRAGQQSTVQEYVALDASWNDYRDEWDRAIVEAFPTRSGSHDEYARAMEMVGNRHSKGELVALVNWLLVLLAKARK